MKKFTEKEVVGQSEVGLGLGPDELVRHGAREVIQQASKRSVHAVGAVRERQDTIINAATAQMSPVC